MRTKLNEKYDQPARNTCYSMADVGHVVRMRRKELNYTQMDLARFTGYSQRLISEIERGRQTVSFDKVMRVVNGLGIDFVLTIRGKQ